MKQFNRGRKIPARALAGGHCKPGSVASIVAFRLERTYRKATANALSGSARTMRR